MAPIDGWTVMPDMESIATSITSAPAYYFEEMKSTSKIRHYLNFNVTYGAASMETNPCAITDQHSEYSFGCTINNKIPVGLCYDFHIRAGGSGKSPALWGRIEIHY